MNWYAFYKNSQFVDFNGLVQSIYQRLIQADRGNPSAESAADDIQSQGSDPQTIENALQQAVFLIVGDQGESVLSEPQRHVVQTIRGGAMQDPNQVQDFNQMQQPMDANQGFVEQS